MQQAPCRLSQTLWSAFRAARPIPSPQLRAPLSIQRPATRWQAQRPTTLGRARFYSDKSHEIEKKAEDAKDRINETITSRAEATVEADDKLKDAREETIVKTDPVASSIVERASSIGKGDPRTSPNPPSPASHTTSTNPNQNPTLASLRARFGHFMDTFQSHLFTASRRLNDLTGYTTIEQLKNDISAQETLVQTTRAAVKQARDAYSSAIATRSTTQREVNDLLHRKHAWTPTDLERFTSLYRNDHANEQAEVAAQREVAEAETRYEEASTKLGRAILARYHEEQVWSDKIRQMSTWGTWGLMGLNVLLFVVFQILIEPWRRRRLVRGFEEKVELALQERDVQLAGLKSSVDSHAAATAAAAAREATVPPPTLQEKAERVAEVIAGHIADAVSGASSVTAEQQAATYSRQDIEAAADTVAAKEIVEEVQGDEKIATTTATTAVETLFASTASGYAYYTEAFRDLWNEDRTMVVTQREMTTRVVEAAVGGAALMGLVMALLRPR